MTGTAPLSFLLWHWYLDGVSEHEYERALSAFHTALREDPPDGFVDSGVVRFDGLPWIAASGPVYQDWYVITDFTAMGVLNEGAVGGSRKGPHDDVAAMAADGVGGLYALEAGPGPAASSGFYHWLRKPKGRTTAEYLDSLRDLSRACEGSLWRRQMNLGTAPEYCLIADRRTDVPGTEHVSIGEGIWPA
ncbi:MAG: hypothetical protein KJO98_01015 [Rhodothermia bacterium]|nr:hypothetical protein [Rhodothermia bacterium]